MTRRRRSTRRWPDERLAPVRGCAAVLCATAIAVAPTLGGCQRPAPPAQGVQPSAREHYTPGIVELPAPPDIDGSLTEWQDLAPLTIPWRDGPEETPPPRAWLAFDDLHLYLALEVPDDTLTFPERSWRFGDGFYLTVLMPGGGEASPAHISFGFSRVGDRLEKVAVNRSGEYFPAVAMDGVEFAMHPGPGDLPLPPGDAAEWPGTARYEVAVPWTLLAPAGPLAVDSLAVNVVVSDRDSGDARSFALLSPDPGFDTERTPVRAGRVLPLVRAPGDDAPPALAAWLPSPILTAPDPPPLEVAVRSAGTGAETVLVEVVRMGRVVGTSRGELPPGRGVRRATLPLTLAGAPGTGPVTVRATTASGLAAAAEAFLVDPAQLDSIRARLEAMERTEPAAATPLIRAEWLARLAASPVANSPLAPPRTWWRELAAMGRDLAEGRTAFLHRDSVPPRLAHRSAIDGSLQPYSVRLPPEFDPANEAGYPLLVALHGSGVDERGTLRSAGAAAAARGWIVVAPRARGLSDWYIGDAEADVLEVVAHAAHLYPVDTTRIALAGFSMGGYGAWRLALRHPDRFRAAAVMAGAICPPPSVHGECAPELLERRMAIPSDHRHGATPGPPLLILHGGLDGAVPVAAAREMVRALSAAGWPHEYREFPRAGHGDPGWWGLVMDWLDAAPGPASGPTSPTAPGEPGEAVQNSP